MTPNSRISLEGETSSSTNNLRSSPLSSATWVNTSITIDATTATNTAQSGNWTWAVAQDWCSGLGTFETPYLIENMTFSPPASTSGLLIKNSKNIYFTINNCTFLDSVTGNFAGIRLENTDNGTIVGCNFSSTLSSGKRFRGIELSSNSEYNTIENNTMAACESGINISESDYNYALNNTITGCDYTGIYIYGGSNTSIVDNFITGCDMGIRINGYNGPGEVRKNNTLMGNYLNNSYIDIDLTHSDYFTLTGNTMESKGLSLEQNYHNQIDTSNTVGGKPIHYYEDQDNLYLDGNNMTDIAQLFVVNSVNSTITNFDIHGMPLGLYVARGVSMNIINNNVSNNYYNGLSLFGLNDSTIHGNIANNNGKKGIFYEGETGPGWDEYDPDFDLISGNNRFTNNSLCYNEYGFQGENGHHDEFSNNIILDNEDDGMYLDGFHHTFISENQISNNSYGLDLYYSPHSVVIDNDIHFNADYGVYAEYSGETTFQSNRINGNYIGIYIYEGVNDTVVDNDIFDSQQEAIYVEYSVEVTIQSNRINGNDIGIYFADTSRSTIVDNDINDNQGEAIRVENLDDFIIKGNNIIGNYEGLYIDDMVNCSILENVIMTSQHYGIQASWLINSTFSGNRIEATNGTGVSLDDDSEENIIYNNRFINNALHAEDNGTLNQWFFANLGNYWDNYTGPDADNDGIGDQPYNISGSANSQDLYPMLDIFAPTIEADDDCFIVADSPHTLSWVVTDAHPDAYYLTRNGSLIQSPESWANGTISYEIAADSLTDGTYVFTLWLNDTFSNQNSASIEVTVDSIAPTITSPVTLTLSPDASSVLVNWTVSDLHPGEYSISFNGAVVVNFTTWTNGVITYNLSLTDLLPGNYTLAITVRDLVGNENTYNIIIVIEEEQPGSMGVGFAIVYFGVGIAGIVGFVIYRSKRS
ncbi:MAG: NosD domain-containing protein [Promethearchaeota archaeon]